MKDFFEAIQSLFEDVLFIPFDALRTLEASTWWGANTLNWLFIAITFVAFIYWMLQLKGFDDEKEERKDVKSHPFLGKNPELD
ncbi:MAG: uracil phosphoribosyltransferase [Psychroflexus sp.]|nr:uracil phosphoribosyltransferase [Psychroflexus sp.]MDN6309208.1 uracil phosphoribosyltransferase [Psychroflexus sp.]